MKSKIKLFLLVFTALGFLFTACNKSEDLVTDDAKTGGLVIPTSSIPYKLGATPTVDVVVTVPMGPGIASIEVYNSYTSNVTGSVSNEVLMSTIDVASANVTEEITKNLSITYSNLKNGIVIDGAGLPDDETLLPIGDFWELSYISVMADGRRVVNNAKTGIAVANIYAGFYQCDGVFHHPTAGDRVINEEKFLTPLSAYSCSIPAGDLGGSGYSLTITVDPTTNDVSFSAGSPVDMLPQEGKRSYYDPETGQFILWYYYVGGSGNRVIDEVYTPL
ncbi:MAG: DUF4361 domain-containing protein [Bacteroidales bacterium]|nr:DUF4361 domain-containing protein [Bacteroidales bacterium]